MFTLLIHHGGHVAIALRHLVTFVMPGAGGSPAPGWSPSTPIGPGTFLIS
jgi:hypothetical protein